MYVLQQLENSGSSVKPKLFTTAGADHLLNFTNVSAQAVLAGLTCLQ
jgi:hypothetical protein